MHRYALRDDQWAKIRDFLPGREGHVGGTTPLQPPVCRCGHLSLSDRHSLARSARAVRELEADTQALSPMVRKRRIRSDFRNAGGR